jgi:peptidoglycan/LPS O-acetylase OafA/YrhL
VALAMGVAVCVFLLISPGFRLAWLFSPFIKRALIAHLFMVHNWSPDLAFMFNGPLWSVAVEVQIYIFFPIMVIVWKRFGAIAMLTGSFIFSHAVLYLSGHRGTANYMFVFALGAYAAELSFDRHKLLGFKLLGFRLALLACLIAFLALPNLKDVYADFIVGVGASCLMVLCARSHTWPRSFLSLPFLTWLGTFSYSIYLVHGVIQTIYLDTAITPLPRFGLGASRLLFMCFGLTPIILVLSYIFHWAVERPFMTVHKVRSHSMGQRQFEGNN